MVIKIGFIVIIQSGKNHGNNQTIAININAAKRNMHIVVSEGNANYIMRSWVNSSIWTHVLEGKEKSSEFAKRRNMIKLFFKMKIQRHMLLCIKLPHLFWTFLNLIFYLSWNVMRAYQLKQNYYICLKKYNINKI